MSNYWQDKKVVIAGGASLIGSHLIDSLLELNPKSLLVVDDLSSGKLKNIPNGVEFRKLDLRNYSDCVSAFKNSDVVFDLACAHGGRLFVDTHELECYDNLSLDATIFRACAEVNVQKVVFSSSACVYRTDLQMDVDSDLMLKEDVENHNNPAKPDGAYGWAKLSAEKTLMAYAKEKKFDVAITRFFTVYGERMLENHAIGALIAKSFIKQNPFEIFGDGKQKRNWTYVKDTVRGIILAAEKLQNDYVNIGTEEVNTPNSACKFIWNYMNWKPNEIKYFPNQLVGVSNRIADSSKAKRLLGWKPKYTFRDGLKDTIDWYISKHDIESVRDNLQNILYQR